MRDGLERTSFGVRTNPSRTFLQLTTRLLALYNATYVVTDHARTVGALRQFIRSVWGRSVRNLIAAEAPDVIVSTHHFLSPATIHGSFPSVPFIMVVSDLGRPHRIWFDPRLHTIMLPTSDMADYAEMALDQRPTVTVRAPPTIIDSGFPISIQSDPGEPGRQPTNTLLLMGGGSGTGGIQQHAQALALAFPEKRIVVVCGWNEPLRTRLAKARFENLDVRGYVSDIDSVFRQCDVVITKAGPVTIMESILHGRPLVVTGWVGMQEKDNVDFVLQHGVGTYSAGAERLARSVNAVYERYDGFVERAQSFRRDGPQRIARYVLDAARHTDGVTSGASVSSGHTTAAEP